MRQNRQAAWNEAAALLAGLLLRALFVLVHPRFTGDTLVYGDLAHNLLAHHQYGLSEYGHVRSTLIRLPGYPLFLASCFALFGTANYLAVLWVQVVIDLLGCWLLSRLTRRLFGSRTGRVSLWLAALCPFTANYAAAALTETLSIFCVVLGFWALESWLRDRSIGRREMQWGFWLGVALAGASLLRPDGILLAAAVLPVMLYVLWRSGRPRRAVDAHKPAAPTYGWRGILLPAALLAGCLGVWTLRNWHVYHVLQPLAPKYANDPGEAAPLGFARWYRTWGIGLGDTARVYWVYDGEVLRMGDLPARAFDSAAQRSATAALLRRYNDETSSTPATEAAFAKLADERIRNHPLRYYVLLPLARLGDMWLRPRTELLPRMPLDWWRFQTRPKAALFGWFYGLLNAALLVCAAAGWVRWWRARWRNYAAMAAAWGGFILLRSFLLMTIDNSEPRYVLECYPVVLALAAFALAGARRTMPARGAR